MNGSSEDLDSFLDEIEAQEYQLGVKIEELNMLNKTKKTGQNILGDNMNELFNKRMEEQVDE